MTVSSFSSNIIFTEAGHVPVLVFEDLSCFYTGRWVTDGAEKDMLDTYTLCLYVLCICVVNMCEIYTCLMSLCSDHIVCISTVIQ